MNWGARKRFVLMVIIFFFSPFWLFFLLVSFRISDKIMLNSIETLKTNHPVSKQIRFFSSIKDLPMKYCIAHVNIKCVNRHRTGNTSWSKNLLTNYMLQITIFFLSFNNKKESFFIVLLFFRCCFFLWPFMKESFDSVYRSGHNFIKGYCALFLLLCTGRYHLNRFPSFDIGTFVHPHCQLKR